VGAEDDRVLIRAMLQQPQAKPARDLLERKFEILFPLLLCFVAALSYINGDRRNLLELAEYTYISHLPHPAVILLLVGFTLFPVNRRAIFAVFFLLTHLLSTLWAFHGGSYQVPASISVATFILSSLLFNAAFGLGLAYVTRRLEPSLSRGPMKPALDVSLSATLFATVILLGTPITVGLTWVGNTWLTLGYPEDMAILAASQTLKTGVFVTFGLIFALYPPSLTTILRASPVLGLFMAVALLDKSLGWQTERIFTIMLAISLRFVMPITTALPITLIAILMQRLIVPDETLNWAQDYLIFAALFTLLTLFDLILLNERSQVHRSRKLQQKLWNSYEFSKYGYFLFNTKLQRFWMDDMIRVAPQRTFSDTLPETLRRMPLKDAARLGRILSTHAPEPQAAIIHIADGSVWTDDGPYRVYRLHSVSETSWQYGLVTIGTLTDITEIHRASSALRDTLSQLRISKERQHRLFALISHELRTPAALLKMLAEQMNETKDWDNLGPRFDAVLAQFLTLMDDMGSVVRDEDLLPASESSFRPNDLLNHLVSVYRVVAEQAGITIDLHSARSYDQERVSDVGRVQQILGNIMRNAVLHSEADHLVIRYREDTTAEGITGVWTIEDNGKGIPDDLLPGLFEPFNRKTRGVFSKADGSGLGMYIVKLFVDNLGGQITYRPAANGGARFEITLPLKEVQANTARIAGDEPAKEQATVLLIEDNPLVAEITQSQLKRTFRDVAHCDSAEAALEQLSKRQPDLILTDIELPGMDGLTLCRELRKRGYEGALFGLSAGALHNSTLEEAGADGILSKPLSMRRLIHELRLLDTDTNAGQPSEAETADLLTNPHRKQWQAR
jgi:signal transduction histidine kinase/AmiR/NasT family two-component response regulator